MENLELRLAQPQRAQAHAKLLLNAFFTYRASYRLKSLRWSVAMILCRIDTKAVGEEGKAKVRRWSAGYQLDTYFSADGDDERPLVADEIESDNAAIFLDCDVVVL